MPPSFFPSFRPAFCQGWQDFSRDVRACLFQTPSDVDSFHSGARSPGEVGMLFGGGAGAEKGEGALVLRLTRVFFTF